MDTTHTTNRLTTIDRWLEPHAAGLVAFADSNELFALTLAALLQEESWSVVEGHKATPSNFYTPLNYEAAEDILDWLMYELLTHPEARASRSVLISWARDYNAPKDIRAGVENLSFDGMPLGFTKRTKQKSQLQIITDKNWQATLKPKKLTQATLTISQELIATELRKAGGKIGSLHPNTAEWCMGGATTKLYETSQAKLNKLHKTAMEEKLHHQIISKDEQVVAMAISPAVNNKLIEAAI